MKDFAMPELQGVLVCLFVGIAFNLAQETGVGNLVLHPVCFTHEDCLEEEVCMHQKCENPCNCACGGNTTCHVEDHVVACACRPGYSGDPVKGCIQEHYPGCWPPYPGAIKRYEVEAIKVNWYTAFAHCLTHGRRLATITTCEENDQIKDVIRKSGLGPRFWASGINYSLDDRWTWMSTGHPFTFTDWSPNQPDNWQDLPGGEHCLELWEEGQYRWNDRNCMELQYPICEYYE